MTKMSWTFDLKGSCIYCEKPATRTRTFEAGTEAEARASADRATDWLCHRKCGGY